MKKAVKRFPVILLMVLVLAGSGGFTIGKMICGGGECSTATYSLGKAKDCCASENEASVSGCCCELINVSLSLDIFNVSYKLSVLAVEMPALLTYLSPTLIHSVNRSDLILSLAHAPPPQDYLMQVGVLRL